VSAGGQIRSLLSILASDDPPTTEPVRPSVRARWIAALAIGVGAGLFSGLVALRPGAAPDFLFPLAGARYFLDGQNPYLAIRGDPSAAPPYNAPFAYPFTSVMPVLPLAGLAAPVALGLFFGLSSGLLAFFVTRHAWWRLHVFMGAPFVVAATLGQNTPLVMVAGLVPAAGFLATVKPNVGLALLLRRPSLPAIAGCAVAGLLSLAIFPSWPAHWLEALRGGLGNEHSYEIPLLQTGGVVLGLAALAWRRASGRVLLALSAVPQALFFYDQILLWLIPRTRKQSILLTASSQLAFILWYLLREGGDSIVRSAYPYVIALLYLPSLLIVLRQRYGVADETGRTGGGGADEDQRWNAISRGRHVGPARSDPGGGGRGP
jgi:hypothetical protein